MSHTIEHSGRTWTSLRIGPNGRHIWPIEEYLIRRKHTKSVAERIARMNPNGKEEGGVIRGVFWKRWRDNSFCGDFVRARKGEPWTHKLGRRKYVTKIYRMQNP